MQAIVNVWNSVAVQQLTYWHLPEEVCPRAPCVKEAESLQQLLVFLHQIAVEENAHIMKLKKYHLEVQQVFNVIVYVSACDACVVYMSAC